MEKRVNSTMVIFADYIKLFKIVNIKTDHKRVAGGSDDLNWLDNKLADEIIDRDEISYYYAEKLCLLKTSVQCQGVIQNVRYWVEVNREKNKRMPLYESMGHPHLKYFTPF